MYVYLDDNNVIVKTSSEYMENGIELNVDIDMFELISGRYKYENNRLVFTNEMTELYKENLRMKRVDLLQAFDVYKSNVNYGIIEESDSEKAEIIKWYKAILSLDETALNNVPNNIKKYL